jgi:hypothetical protein
MDAADILDSLDTLIYSIASRCVVHVDGFTLGRHPEPEPREAGELALLDWNQTGGPLVAETDRAIPELVDRVGWARALGAALAALEKSDDAELDVLHDLITGARWIEETRPGGPADPELRLALATRCAALAAMGNPGEIADKVAKRRPVHTDVLMLDPYEFRIYTVLAHLPLCDADRGTLAGADVAAAPAVPPVLVVALQGRPQGRHLSGRARCTCTSSAARATTMRATGCPGSLDISPTTAQAPSRSARPRPCWRRGGRLSAAQDILGGRAAVLLALLDGPARAVTLHDRIRARAGRTVVVTDGACRKALACLERDGLAAPLEIVGSNAGFELTAAGRTEALALRAAALALARPMTLAAEGAAA